MKKTALILALVSIPFLKLFAQYYDTLQVSISSDDISARNIPVNLCASTIVLNNDFKWDYKYYTIDLNRQLAIQSVALDLNEIDDAGKLAANDEQLMQKIKDLCFALRPNMSLPENGITLQLTIKNIRNMVWTIVDEMPEFIHQDYSSFLDYIKKNISHEIVNSVPLEGSVYVEFIINFEGVTTDIKVTKAVHPKLDMEAIRIIKSSPLWKPGNQRRSPTNVRVMYPVSFKK